MSPTETWIRLIIYGALIVAAVYWPSWFPRLAHSIMRALTKGCKGSW